MTRTAIRNGSGQWTEIPSAGSLSKSEFALVALRDGRILRVGGTGMKASVEIFDPFTRRWSEIAPMKYGRTRPVGSLLPDGRVLVSGGNHTTRETELFDPDAGTWTTGPAMHKIRYGHVVAELDSDHLLFAGGEEDGGTSEIYNAATQVFEVPRSMPWMHYFQDVASVKLSNGRVLVAGGREGTETSIYDPATKSWTAGPPLMTPNKQGYFRFERLPSGKILAPGGINLSFAEATARVEVLE